MSSPRRQALREVLSVRSDRRRRDGGGVPGGRDRSAGIPAHAGHQANALASVAGRSLRQDVHRRGQAVRPALASEPGSDLRVRTDRRELLHRHGARPGRDAARRTSEARRGAAHRAGGGQPRDHAAGLPGAELRAWAAIGDRAAARHRPPRHLAVEPHALVPWWREDPRLRNRPRHRGDSRDEDPGRHHEGEGRVHVPGAGPDGADRQPVGHLRRWNRAPRDAHGPPAVQVHQRVHRRQAGAGGGDPALRRR